MRFLLVFALLVAAVYGVPAPSEPSTAEKQLWTAMGEFGHSLLKQIIAQANDQKNVLISPLSIHSALSMVVPGAGGQTKDEMVRTMQLNGIDPEDLKNAFSALTTRKHENTTKPGQFFSEDLQFTMRLANRMYAQKSYPFDPSYVNQVKTTFHADAVNVDFTGNGEGVKNEINGFVKQKTNDLIPKILQEPLDKDTVMVLVNALYFKGDWDKKMNDRTAPLSFNKGCGKLEQEHTKWLSVTERLPYLESASLDAKLVLIPYKASQYSASMLIILPNEAHSCKTQEWLQLVQWTAVRGELKKMQITNVALTLPRFEMGYRTKLQDVLPTMGMSQVFKKGQADLSAMVSDPNERLNIDQVIHETKMIVTKFGTEAAAATSVSVTRLGAFFEQREPIQLTVDKSFYVAILYHKLGVDEVLPLFAGVVHDV